MTQNIYYNAHHKTHVITQSNIFQENKNLSEQSLLSATMYRFEVNLMEKKYLNIKMLKLFCLEELCAQIFRE